MKLAATYLWLFIFLLASVPAIAQDDEGNSGGDPNDEGAKALRRNWSLFSEAYKMNDFNTAKHYGWIVRETAPTRFKTLHPKMINIYDSLWSRAEDPASKTAMADTMFLLINEAMTLFPDKKDQLTLQRGYMYERLYTDKKPEAIADYEAGIHSDYANADMWYLDRLGILYSEKPETKAKAITVLQAVLLRDPNNVTAQGIIKTLITDPKEYVGLLRDAYYADPANRQKLYELANGFYEQLQDYDSAAVYFDKLTKEDPSVKNYWERLAVCYMYLGKYSTAIDTYKKLVALDAENKEGWINLARAQIEVGKLQEARSSAEKAIDVAPDWGAPYMIIGQIYEAAAKRCVESRPKGWEDMKIPDKAMYSLAQSVYRKAASDPQFAEQARSRIGQIASLTPTAEDLFRNGIAKGTNYQLNSGCYSWIGRSVVLTY